MHSPKQKLNSFEQTFSNLEEFWEFEKVYSAYLFRISQSLITAKHKCKCHLSKHKTLTDNFAHLASLGWICSHFHSVCWLVFSNPWCPSYLFLVGKADLLVELNLNCPSYCLQLVTICPLQPNSPELSLHHVLFTLTFLT